MFLVVSVDPPTTTHSLHSPLSTSPIVLQKPGMGLNNIYNSCPYNACLQFLSGFISVTFLKEFLKTNLSHPLANALLILIEGRDATPVYEFIKKLRNEVKDDPEGQKEIGVGETLDAGYLLRYLGSKYSDLLEPYFTTTETSRTCDDCGSQGEPRRENQILFPVPIAEALKNEGPPPKSGRKQKKVRTRTIELKDLLTCSQRYKSAERDFNCESCKNNAYSIHDVKFTSQYLTIEFQRSTIDINPIKSEIGINCPDLLELGPQMSYTLLSTLHHQGDVSGGHWWANVRTVSDGWIKMNDKETTKLKKRSKNTSIILVHYWISG